MAVLGQSPFNSAADNFKSLTLGNSKASTVNNSKVSFVNQDFTFNINPLSANPEKWSNTQTIRRQFADELFECV